MKTYLIAVVVSLISRVSLCAGGADEKAFIEKYKTAWQTRDIDTLQSFFYTQGSDPQIVEDYKQMLASAVGGIVTKIELVALTAEEIAKAVAPGETVTSRKVCPTLKPTKKLLITAKTMNFDGSYASTTSTNLIAEKDGKFVIPVPGPCR